MNLRIVVRVFVTSILIGWGQLGLAGYNVEVQKKSNFPAGVGAMAILPATCPAEVDCVWLNRFIADQFKRRNDIRSIPVDVVRQVMMDENITNFDGASRLKLSEKLGVESFAAVTIGHSGSTSSDAFAMPIGNSFYIAESQVAEGSVQFDIVSASDGSVLLTATGHGKSEFRSPIRMLAKTFAEILVKAFPRS